MGDLGEFLGDRLAGACSSNVHLPDSHAQDSVSCAAPQRIDKTGSYVPNSLSVT
jgi:hypothetical protein